LGKRNFGKGAKMIGKMRVCIKAIGLLALILAPRVVKAEDVKIGQFLKEYDAANSDTKDLIEKLIVKLEYGFIVANAHLEGVRKQPRLYCQPDQLSLMGSQIVAMLRRQTQQNPESEKWPLGVGMLQTYINVFPCRGTKDSERFDGR
jgi:hypothetical protein